MSRIRQASSIEMVYETKKPTGFSAADVKEVRHGKWITNNNQTRCSICGKPSPLRKVMLRGAVVWEYDSPANYCPNCGAKMSKVKGERK